MTQATSSLSRVLCRSRRLWHNPTALLDSFVWPDSVTNESGKEDCSWVRVLSTATPTVRSLCNHQSSPYVPCIVQICLVCAVVLQQALELGMWPMESHDTMGCVSVCQQHDLQLLGGHTVGCFVRPIVLAHPLQSIKRPVPLLLQALVYHPPSSAC